LDYKLALPKYSISNTVGPCSLPKFFLALLIYEQDCKNCTGVNFEVIYDNFEAGASV
jgi:hypothetical protein